MESVKEAAGWSGLGADGTAATFWGRALLLAAPDRLGSVLQTTFSRWRRCRGHIRRPRPSGGPTPCGVFRWILSSWMSVALPIWAASTKCRHVERPGRSTKNGYVDGFFCGKKPNVTNCLFLVQLGASSFIWHRFPKIHTHKATCCFNVAINSKTSEWYVTNIFWRSREQIARFTICPFVLVLNITRLVLDKAPPVFDCFCDA